MQWRSSGNGDFQAPRTPKLSPCLMIPPGLIVAPRRRDRRPVAERERPGRGHQRVDLEVRRVGGHEAPLPAHPGARARRQVEPVAATAAVLVVPLAPGEPGVTKRKSRRSALDLGDRARVPAILAGQPAAGPAPGIGRGRGVQRAPRQAQAGLRGARDPRTPPRTVPLVLMVPGGPAPLDPPAQVLPAVTAEPVEVAVRPTGATGTAPDRVLGAHRPGPPVRLDAQAPRPGIEPPPPTLARSPANPSTVLTTTIRCPKGQRSGATSPGGAPARSRRATTTANSRRPGSPTTRNGVGQPSLPALSLGSGSTAHPTSGRTRHPGDAAEAAPRGRPALAGPRTSARPPVRLPSPPGRRARRYRQRSRRKSAMPPAWPPPSTGSDSSRRRNRPMEPLSAVGTKIRREPSKPSPKNARAWPPYASWPAWPRTEPESGGRPCATCRPMRRCRIHQSTFRC